MASRLVTVLSNALLLGAASCWVVSCGSRSGTNGHGDLSSLNTRDSGVIDVAIGPSRPVRPNPVAVEPGDPPDDEPPDFTSTPNPVPAATPPSIEPEVPTPAPEPSPEVFPEPESFSLEPESFTFVEPEVFTETTTTDVESEPSTDTEEPLPADELPLWLYINEGSGLLVNVWNQSDRVETLPGVDPLDVMIKPWSRDGSRLVTLDGADLLFWDLTVSGAMPTRIPGGTEMTLLGWVDGYGALVGYYYEASPVLYLVSEAGVFTLVGDTQITALATRATVSPSGDALLYTTDVGGIGTVNWVSLAGGVVSSPTPLLSGEPLALYQAAWSSTGQWGAFADGSGDIYLFNRQAPSLLSFAGSGASYFEFSPAEDAFASYNGGVLEVFALLAAGMTSSTALSVSDAASPGRFSADGQYLYYASPADVDVPSGVLRQMTQGAPGDYYYFDSFGFECPLTWTAPDTYLHQNCVSVDRELLLGTISGASQSTSPVSSALLPQLTFGDEHRCFVNWGDNQLDLGSTVLPLATEFTRVAGSTISHVVLAPDESAMAWVEGGSDVYWLPINDNCTVSSLPSFVASTSVQALAFVAE